MPSIFDPIADDYDTWYDTIEGSTLFQMETQCLRTACQDYSGRWLEIGVGTGRFATALEIDYGMDLSLPMIQKAVQRGIQAQVGSAEHLPYRDSSFDGVLMVLTLCFIQNPQVAIQNCFRILKDKGSLVIGTIPADSPWGKAYMEQGAKGHPVYSHARFRNVSETLELVENSNFKLKKSYSTLFGEPDNHRSSTMRIESGIVGGAGFVGMLFEPTPR